MLLIRGAMLPDFETGTTTQADVLIRDGRFAAIAPHLEADCPIVEASGLLMLPGMADLHTHMVQSLTQGPLDDLNITQWLTRMLRAQWSLTEDEWYYGVLLGCLRSIRYGVTAINEMTYYPHIDAVVQAYQDAGLRVTFGIGATDIAENDQIRVTPVDECLRQAEELYHKWHGRGLLRTAAVPQGRPACTPELMRALKQFARERGLLYHTHLAEGKAETECIRAWTGRGEAEELAHLGVLDESTILAHSIWLTQEEITLLAQSHAVVAHCPSTNMKLSDGAPPIAELLASGARVGFGCDGEASSANRDLLREARPDSAPGRAVLRHADGAGDACARLSRRRPYCRGLAGGFLPCADGDTVHGEPASHSDESALCRKRRADRQRLCAGQAASPERAVRAP